MRCVLMAEQKTNRRRNKWDHTKVDSVVSYEWAEIGPELKTIEGEKRNSHIRIIRLSISSTTHWMHFASH